MNLHLNSSLKQISAVDNFIDFRDFLINQNFIGRSERFLDVEMDISNICNLRCVMCYFSFDKYAQEDPLYLTPEKFSYLAQSLLPYARTLNLSLGNEPLTSPYFVDLLKIASNYELEHLSFSTNGLLMDREIAEAVLDSGVTEVVFSIDGATKQTYEKIRLGGDFARLLENIRMLAKMRTMRGNGIPKLRCDTVLMQSNIQELKDIVYLASDLGIDKINLNHLVVYKGLGMESESLYHSQELSDKCLAEAHRVAEQSGIEVVSTPKPFFPGMPEGRSGSARPSGFLSQVLKNNRKRLISILNHSKRWRMKKALAVRPDPFCIFPFCHVSINSEGHILPCPFSHGIKPYGNIFNEKSFDQIWFGQEFRKLRENILDRKPQKMCRRCSYLSIASPTNRDFFKPRDP